MNRWTRQQFNEWRQAAGTQKAKHEWMARAWAIFGVYGSVDYIARNGLVLPKEGIADSVPVLFVVSVLAMYQGEKGQAGNYRIEEKQEDAEQAAHS